MCAAGARVHVLQALPGGRHALHALQRRRATAIATAAAIMRDQAAASWTLQDVLAYLRLAVSLRDDVALERVINVPRRAVGGTSVDRLKEFANAQVRGRCL